MRSRATAWNAVLLASLAMLPAALRAEPIPAPVAAMIDAAAFDPAALKIVADLARKTNPRSVAEIDARLADFAAKAGAAQAERLAHQRLFEGWKGEGQLGAFVSSGNTSSTGLAAGLKLSREGLRWKHTLAGAAEYERDDGHTIKQRFLAGYGINYKLSHRAYLLGLLSWEQDKLAGFDRRFSEGIGLGYKIVDTPRLELALEAGPALRQTHFTFHGDDSSLTARVASELAWKIGPAVTLTESASYFIGGESNTFTSEAALTAKVYGALSARLSFFLTSESNPQPFRRATDSTSRVTLVYGF